MQVLAYFIISLLASVAGAICGIGGGVIIKPTLDLFHLDSVATVSFLSGCTVLAMSCYSVTKSMRAGDSRVDLKVGTPLAIGAAVGGVVGKQMFSAISARRFGKARAPHELKGIGRSINQLAVLSNMGRIQEIHLGEVWQMLSRIYLKLQKLTEQEKR